MAFNFRKKITIDHTKVAASLSDFPVLISGTYADLKSVGNGGQVQNGSGYDIVFYSDSSLTTKLKFEVAYWNPATGQIIAWVKIPTLSNSVDTEIYVGVGNSAITTDQTEKNNVWDSNYAGVYHLADNQANTTVLDSKGSNNGTNASNNTSDRSVTGKIFKALSYNGSNTEYSDFGTSLAFDSNNFTIEGWCKIVSNLSNARPFNYFFNGPTLFVNGGNFALVHGGTIDIANLGFTPNVGVWQHIVLTRTNGDFKVIVNGSEVYSTNSLSVSFSASGNIRLGCDTYYNNAANCHLEEIRYSTIGRSTDWATTSFNNQNSPSTFYSLADYPFPLDADFTASTAINYGSTLSISDATTGGSGTKTRVWKIDGVTVTPANGNYVNPTFTGLSVGNHTIRLEVTDDSGSDSAEKTVAVASITGSATINHGATNSYSTNVPSPVWSIVSGGGTINSSTGALTAPSSGSGLITIKAEKSGDSSIYATKVVEINTRITTTSPLSGTLGFSVSGSFAAEGGVGSGTFSKVSGSYPAGITVAGDGSYSGTFSASESYSFRLRYVDSSNASNNVEKDFILNVSVIIVPASIWSRMGIVPTTNLLKWGALDNANDGSEVGDYSGNDRKMLVDSSYPTLQTLSAINNKKALYFDDSKQPLVFSGTFTAKHIFIVAAIDETVFGNYKGLLTTLTKDLLVGQSGTSKINPPANAIGTYKKSFVEFSSEDYQAPMQGKFAIIELVYPAGIELDGIVIGQNKSDGALKLKGWYVEDLMYGEIQDDFSVRDIYEYFAIKFHLWRKKLYSSTELNVFPLAPDRDWDLSEADLAEVSEAEGQRGRDKVVRYLNDDEIKAWNLQFETRHSLETNTIRAFLKEHRLHLPYWYLDPELEIESIVVTVGTRSIKGQNNFAQTTELSIKEY